MTTISLEYADRLSKQKKRLEAQKERILKQIEIERKRALSAQRRGEAITGIDELEMVKLSKQDEWRAKWNKRRAKWDARARKYGG